LANRRESTGCKNVTSFRYSGASNHISKEDVDDDNDVQNVDKNDVLLPSDIDELASTKFLATGLGDFLPACSPETADHCGSSPAREETAVKKKNKKKKNKKGLRAGVNVMKLFCLINDDKLECSSLCQCSRTSFFPTYDCPK
jgi:hypothetical protein